MTNLVASYTPGTNRTDGGGLGVGVFFTYTGPTGQLCYQLGARVGTGNSGNAVISVSSGGGSNNGQLDAQTTVSFTGGVAGTFIYGNCTPFALTNNRSYCLCVAIGAGQNLAGDGAVTMNNGTPVGSINNVTPGNGSGVGFSGGAIMRGGVDLVFATVVPSTANTGFFFGAD